MDESAADPAGVFYLEENARKWRERHESTRDVLEKNPSFAEFLPKINQHRVAMLAGQEDKEYAFEHTDMSVGRLLRRRIEHGASDGEVGKYALALTRADNVWTCVQRFYLALACKDETQAKRIARAVKDLCFWELSVKDGPRYGNWNRGPMTVTLCKDAHGHECEQAWCIAPRTMASDSWHLRLSEAFSIPPALPVLFLVSWTRAHLGDAGKDWAAAIFNNILDALTTVEDEEEAAAP